ncbi:MAG: hypothetical protein D6E12_11190 [Desulfovibrio sp.]|nr:MAG: hypothetical protein D6E12_11190 [Desulfovibrio sp.]
MRDHWVIGVSEQGAVHIVRTVTPFFSAKVLGPARAIEGIESEKADAKRHVLCTGHVLHDFSWRGEPPHGAFLERILAEAEEAWLYITAMHPHLARLVEDH